MTDCLTYVLGVMQADPGVIREYDHIFRLYCHESQRVFHDRLVDKRDKKYFNTMLSEMASKHFSKVCLVKLKLCMADPTIVIIASTII